MIDIVKFIRNNPAGFPQWRAPYMAKLFSQPVFVNIKENKGYWF